MALLAPAEGPVRRVHRRGHVPQPPGPRATASGRPERPGYTESEGPHVRHRRKGTSSTALQRVAVAARDDDAVDAHARHGAALAST